MKNLMKVLLVVLLILPIIGYSNNDFIEIENGDTTYSDTLPDGYEIVDSIYVDSRYITDSLYRADGSTLNGSYTFDGSDINLPAGMYIEYEFASNCSVYIKMKDESNFGHWRKFNIELNNNIIFEGGEYYSDIYDTSIINIRPNDILKIEHTGTQSSAVFNSIESITVLKSPKKYIVEKINTSVYNHEESISVKLYPNPVVNELRVDFGEYVNNIEYQIFNTSGKLVNQGYTQNRIDMSNLNKGMYIVTFNYNGNLIKEKVIKR